jgi:hypothetical protein
MDPIARFRQREAGLTQWCAGWRHLLNEQRHCEEGTPERAYWHHGYLMALRDVLRILDATPGTPDTATALETPAWSSPDDLAR